jgi:hypothetical protein
LISASTRFLAQPSEIMPTRSGFGCVLLVSTKGEKLREPLPTTQRKFSTSYASAIR